MSEAVDSVNSDNKLPDVEFVIAFQKLVGEVFRLNGQLLSTADQLSKDIDISTARWQAIATIRNQAMTVAQISRRLGIKRQSAQQTINRLNEQGLTEPLPNPDHRRSPLIGLTVAGQAVMEILNQRQMLLTGAFTQGLGLSIEAIDALASGLKVMRTQAEQLDTNHL
jgi:DNA-binding MarR family transcriptional regulator